MITIYCKQMHQLEFHNMAIFCLAIKLTSINLVLHHWYQFLSIVFQLLSSTFKGLGKLSWKREQKVMELKLTKSFTPVPLLKWEKSKCQIKWLHHHWNLKILRLHNQKWKRTSTYDFGQGHPPIYQKILMLPSLGSVTWKEGFRITFPGIGCFW